METLQVFRNKELAGYLTQTDDRTFIFEYDDAYFNNPATPPVSLTLPKEKKVYTSNLTIIYLKSKCLPLLWTKNIFFPLG
jgi:HipA-like protein